MDRRLVIAALLSASLVAGRGALGGEGGAAQAPTPTPPTPVPPVKTGKERLGDKASDEQRVDDCNVPPERRGTRVRPTGCGRQVVKPSE